jgi:hypothetical protein
LSGLLLIGIILQFYQRIFGRRRRARRYARFLRAAILREFDCRNGPPSSVASDGNSQPVGFVKRVFQTVPRFSVAEDYGLADKFDLGVMERAEDRGRATFNGGHPGLTSQRLGSGPVCGPIPVAEYLFTRMRRELDHYRPARHAKQFGADVDDCPT